MSVGQIDRPKRVKRKSIVECIQENITRPDYLEIIDCGSKGRGIAAKTHIEKGDYVLHYVGKRRYTEKDWRDDSYVFEILSGRKKIWIDATEDDGSFCRLVNDDHVNPNMIVKPVPVGGETHVVFFAARKILAGEELSYTYGGSSERYPWRKEIDSLIQESPKNASNLLLIIPEVEGSTVEAEKTKEARNALCEAESDITEALEPQMAQTIAQNTSQKDDAELELYRPPEIDSLIQESPKNASNLLLTVAEVEGSTVEAEKTEEARNALCEAESDITEALEPQLAQTIAQNTSQKDDAKLELYRPPEIDSLIQESPKNASNLLLTVPEVEGSTVEAEKTKEARNALCEAESDITEVFEPQMAETIAQNTSQKDDAELELYRPPEIDSLIQESPRNASNPLLTVPEVEGLTVAVEKTKEARNALCEAESDITEVLEPQMAETIAQNTSQKDDALELYRPPVDKAKRNKSGNFILDKRQFCCFCDKSVLKLSRHLMTTHKEKIEVKRLQALKESKDGKGDFLKGVKKLKCLGNFNHNIKEIAKGGSNIVVVKRPIKDRAVSEFLPCTYCLGFYFCGELWRHESICEFKTKHHHEEEQGKKLSVLIRSKILLESAGAVDSEKHPKDNILFEDLKAEVLMKGKRDDIYKTIIHDELIQTFGAVLLKKLGPRRSSDICQRMRQLARLLITLNLQAEENETFMKYLCGRYFDNIVTATEELCGLHVTSDGRRGFNTPSLAIRLGHLLVKLANVKRGICLRRQDMVGREESDAFLSLHNSEWTDSISSNALNSLKRRKDQMVNFLPLTEDLLKIKKYLTQEMQLVSEILRNDTVYPKWRKLAQIVMSRLITFNKRRGGEVSRILLTSYTNRPDWQNTANSEIMATLKPLEKEMMKRLDLIQIPGKKNRKVPVLMTADVKNALDLLVSCREKVNIPSKNPYLFASKSTSGYLDSWQALNTVVTESEAKHPEMVTSTKLRKYNATVCQLFDLNHGELEWLANHMGHEIQIHKDFYRLHDSTIEMTKVSRILTAIDSGNAQKYIGKRLEDIGLNELTNEDSSDEEVNIENDTELDRKLVIGLQYSDMRDPQEKIKEGNENLSDREVEGMKAKKDSHQRKTVAGFKRIQVIRESDSEEELLPKKQKTVRPDSDSEDELLIKKPKTVIPDSDSEDELLIKKTKTAVITDSGSEEEILPKKSETVSKRISWSHEEISGLKSCFGYLIEQKLYPNKKQIERMLNKFPILQRRTNMQIKAKLQHMMKQLN